MLVIPKNWMVVIAASCVLSHADWKQYPATTTKKLIEVGNGNDKRGPTFWKDNITAMEQLRPYFSGVVINPGNGSADAGTAMAFNPNWSASTVDSSSLAQIKWKTFTDNFLLLWSNDDYNMSYWDDSHWQKISANLRRLARAAKNGKCKGICWDAEFYSTRSPWSFADHGEGHTLVETRTKVRQRGREMMTAMQSEFPDIAILTMYFFSYVPDQDWLNRSWALLPDFHNGFLDVVGPNVIIIEGDEQSYYWSGTTTWFDRYAWAKETLPLNGYSNVAANRVDPQNIDKYYRQVQVGRATYTQYKNDPPRYGHNVYAGLLTTDEYVWMWTEGLTWWDNVDLGAMEDSVISARNKYSAGQRLGYDMISTGWDAGYTSKVITANLTSPIVNASIATGQPVTITATATGSTIDRVEFFCNTTKVGEDPSAPYSFTLNNLPEREYTVVARAFSGDLTGTSQPVNIRVGSTTESKMPPSTSRSNHSNGVRVKVVGETATIAGNGAIAIMDPRGRLIAQGIGWVSTVKNPGVAFAITRVNGVTITARVLMR